MKLIQSVLIVALFASFGHCDIPGTLITLSRFAARLAPTCVGTYAPVCGDCMTLWKCQNNANPTQINCKTSYPTRPFCSNGACVASAPVGDTTCSNPFKCTDAGYFPSPSNCSRYHLCAAESATGNGVATYECPSGFVYNPETTMCRKSSSASDCSEIDCSVDPIGYVPYPADNKFFASCTPDEEPLMLKCQENFVYKPSDYNCVFQCPREGRIADSTDDTKYYECYNNETTFLYRLNTCVDSFKFDATTEQCAKPPKALPDDLPVALPDDLPDTNL